MTDSFVLALKYDQDDEYRYFVATDMTWRALDIAQARTLRGLIEVFFEDWKAHHGWVNLAKPPGEQRSVRGASLSLRLDHCGLSHPEQTASVEHHPSARTVGRLIHHTQVEFMVGEYRLCCLAAWHATRDPFAEEIASAFLLIHPARSESPPDRGFDLLQRGGVIRHGQVA